MALPDINNNKNDTDTRIITDEPTKEATDFREYSRKLSKIIINSKPRFTVGIYGGGGIGKTTLMQMIKVEIDTNYPDNVQTVWFDAWRYEKEEHSAMIPLLRTIILSLNNAINNSNDSEKKNILNGIETQFRKIGGAIIRNTSPKVGINMGYVAEAQFDISKMIDDYKSDGSFLYGQERIYFHEHITDHLKEELQKIRGNKSKKYNDFKLVIFIDDLDRCTPERALELLESIKTFFDIEGIIYVIGIDPVTIDPIIKTKYENNPKIDGMHYLQKIVQLPFQIPVWSSVDLSNVIRNLIKEARLAESYSNEILKETNQELIIKATQLNPRDIKRFINSIVLARDIYGQDIEDIDKIIAIQAFYFHGHKWIEFLKLLIPYEQRVRFLRHFILLLQAKLKDITVLDDFRNIIEDENIKEKEDYSLYKSLMDYYPYREDKSLNDVYKRLVEINDNDLFTFLKIASVPLLKIDKIDRYLRVVDTTGLTIKTKDFKDIDSKKQLKLLQDQKVEEFNVYHDENILIHLPHANLQQLKLPGIKLSSSMLFMADLSGADLSEADLTMASLTGAKLSKADLTNANLTKANLTKANLTKANLSWADLIIANLTMADLIIANLSGADLSEANLTKANLIIANLTNANLTKANLSGANLTMANLSGADLSEANLTKANLSGAKLSEADLTNANLTKANLSGANLTKANLSWANLTNSIIINNIFSEDTGVADTTNFKDAIIDNHEFLEHLRKNRCKNIPEEEIRNKQDLKLKLETSNLDRSMYDYLLEISKLPST